MRYIKLIYDDVINLMTANNIQLSGIGITSIQFSNYTGDSQIISQDLLREMFRMLLLLIENASKNTFTNPYASEKVLLFDSGWWSTTGLQTAEINSIMDQGYGDTPQVKQWNIDENGGWVNSYAFSVPITSGISGVSFNGELFLGGDFCPISKKGQFNDRYQLSDFTTISSGSLFDPDLLYMESFSEIEKWLEAYDSVLLELKESTFSGSSLDFNDRYITVDYNKEMAVTEPLRPVSDSYEVRSGFDDYYWTDDLTGESGVLTQQRVRLWRFGNGSSDFQETYVYSEDLTYNVDDGEGGYEQIVLTTSEDGVNFNDSLTTLHDLAVSTFPDTKTYIFGFSHNRDNVEYNTEEVLYDGGTLSQNGSGYFESLDRTKSGQSNVNNEFGFSFMQYDNYNSKVYSYWNGSNVTDKINAGIKDVETQQRDGFPFEYSIEDYVGEVNMISKEIVGSYTLQLTTAIDKSVLIGRTEVIDLQAPV